MHKNIDNTHTHDYRDTIKEAAEIEDDSGKTAYENEEKFDADIAFETLVVNSSMGMLGMEETNANLLQLELAQEILYDLNRDRDDERDPLD